MMQASGPRVATDEVFVLAEGPFWDPRRGLIRWVDIRRGLVLAGTLESDGGISVVERVALEGTVGAMAPSASGAWICANGDDLVEVVAGEVARRIPVLASSGSRRFNDGKPDAAGRYLVGTLSLSGPSETEQLLAVEADGSWRVIDDDLTLSNGIAWSADDSTLYTIDTMRQRVYTRPYDPADGSTGARDVLIELDDGFPDGMCVDADDHLWIAIWGLGQVRRYSPAGDLVQTIEVPAPNTSSVAFAGPLLDTLVITTASDELTPEQLEAHPLSGRLFTFVPGVTGLPQPLWGGFTLPNGMETA
jgi:sugar lactone lactonase YvrE